MGFPFRGPEAKEKKVKHRYFFLGLFQFTLEFIQFIHNLI